MLNYELSASRGGGKLYSCQPCGAGYLKYMSRPNSLCSKFQIADSLDVRLFVEAASARAHVELAMRTGVYIRTAKGSFDGQNDFDWPLVFGGSLHACRLTVGPCAWDTSLECFTTRCAQTNIVCPPHKATPCPGYVYNPCSFSYVRARARACGAASSAAATL